MTLRNGTLEHGDRVEVYRNLHNNTFSVRLLGVADKWDTKRWRDVGKVIKHFENWMTLYLQNVTFAVQPAGQAKVRREGKKNVHAFVRGTVIKAHDNKFGETFKERCNLWVTYNPYQNDSFVSYVSKPLPLGGSITEFTPIRKANLVTLNQGYVYASL